MIESLLRFKMVRKKPYLMILWSFVICTIAIAVSMFVDRAITTVDAGFLTVLFTIIPSTYFFTRFFKREEEMEEKELEEAYKNRKKLSLFGFWERHSREVFIMAFFFIGVVLAFAIWSTFLPQDFFLTQYTELGRVRGVDILTGHATTADYFGRIFSNNLNILFLSFIFSLIFGAGAVFILIWNAGIIGAFIGYEAKSIWSIWMPALMITPHGIFEIVGYILAAMAGAILSAAIVRRGFLLHKKENTFLIIKKKDTSARHIFLPIVFDCLILLVIAFVFILTGAFIESL